MLESLAAGLELTESSLDFARRRGLTHHEMWTRSARLWYLFDLGKWDELLREAEEVLQWDREQGGTQIELNVLTATAPVLAHRGRLDEAARQAAIFLPRAREVGDPQALGPALINRPSSSAVRGDLAEAVSLVEEVVEFAQEKVEVFGGLDVLVQIYVAAGELAAAERLVQEIAVRPATIVGINSLKSSRALLAEARGDYEEAAAAYREAEAGWREWGSVFLRAYALHGLGRCGDEEAAREAAAIFERLGAAPFSAIARAA